MKKFFLMACLASLFASCDSAPKVDNSTVSSVDLNRYLGSWYEIARYDHSFERGLEYAMAKYTLREDGRAKDAKGIAKTTGVPGLLRVSFFGPFFSDYRIMMLDAEYQYVLVGGGNQNYLWILSRTPQLEDSTKTLILAEAERRGYDTNKLIWVKQW